jgi:hypothetical protein
MSRSFEQRTNGLVLYAVIIAGLASRGLVGNYTYFGSTSATVSGAQDWLMVAAVLGFGASKIVAPKPLYHGLAKGFIEAARLRVQIASVEGEAVKEQS